MILYLKFKQSPTKYELNILHTYGKLTYLYNNQYQIEIDSSWELFVLEFQSPNLIITL